MGWAGLKELSLRALHPIWLSARDLLPIIATMVAFQLLVFRQPLENLWQILIGLALVVLGLTAFVAGLEIGLFPLGQQMAHDFARKGSLGWLLAFAFTLGFGATLAEPALIAIANEAARFTVEATDSGEAEGAQRRFAVTLRVTVALAVGVALALGVIRIIFGWPIHYFIIGGYLLAILLTPFAPRSIVALAYDCGGVTTSTITVPLTAALGVGLASSIKGRNPLTDGFGLIAFASLTPIVFVLVLGMIWS